MGWFDGQAEGVHTRRVGLPRRERLSLPHRFDGQLTQDRLDAGRVAQPQSADQDRTVFLQRGPQPVPVPGHPAGGVVAVRHPQHHGCAGRRFQAVR